MVAQSFGDHNLITGNQIFGNIALGIDLGADFLTANDALDADNGANALQNFPVITTVIGQPFNLVQGTLHSAPFKTYTVEVFSNSSADPSDYGEGEVFEGAFTVTTDAAGDGALLAGFGKGNSGGCITATARDRSTGDTSEFSFCETIPPPPAPMALDFGDAPDGDGGYPTLLINNGARHLINLGVFMGSLVDGDPDGQPNNDATGDDDDGSSDEHGIDFVGPLVAHSFPASVRVSVNAIGKLNAWIDFNRDGDWDDDSDRIFADEPLVPGPNNLSFITPAESIAGQTFARFRFSTQGGLGPIGPALDGEVEDYAVAIIDSVDVIFIDGRTVKSAVGIKRKIIVTATGTMTRTESSADEPLVPGPNNLSFITPAESIAGQTFARFRFSTQGGLGPIGPALDGEVEDYAVAIIDSVDVIFIDGFESGETSAWLGTPQTER